MPDYSFEPELNQPVPRRVKLRDGYKAGCAMWVPRLILFPHTFVGFGLLTFAVLSTFLFLAVALFGSEREGTIIKKDLSRSVKGSQHYYLIYRYSIDGQIYEADVRVSAERFAGVNEGDAITVRAVGFFPNKGPWPRVPGHWPIVSLGEIWLPTLFWNGILSLILWQMYVRPWRQRWLIRKGVPTIGIVRSVTEQQNRGAKSYRIEYEYAAVPMDGLEPKKRKGRVTSTVKGAELAKAGDLLTVLYHPHKPDRSIAYRYTDYRAAP